jgi:hypothetical protein
MPHEQRLALQIPGIRSMLTLVAERRLVPLRIRGHRRCIVEPVDRRLSVSREVSVSRLNGIRACVFDAYGTIFDFASAAEHCPGIPEDRRAALTTLWRDKQLQYTWLRTLQGRYVDFWQVTGDALDFALESLGLLAPHLHERLMALVKARVADGRVLALVESFLRAGVLEESEG